MGDNATKHISLAPVVRRLWSFVPLGGSLPEDVWHKRRQFLWGLTWFHAVIIALIGPVFGYNWEISLNALFRDGTVAHTVLEGLIVAFFAASAGWSGTNRTFQATAIGFGLMSSSAILVHLSGGYIEFHFHFFVMLTFLALFQDWIPYILAIVYVAVHHGLVGALWPEEVYNHISAFNAPWTWAGIHAFFVLWASVGSVIAWRFNEIAFARTKLILESAGAGIFGLDLEGKLTFVNPTGIKILGLDPRQVVNKQIHQIMRHRGADGTPFPAGLSPILASLKDGTARQGTGETVWREDGTSFPVEYVSTPIIERGQLTGVVVTFNDITERKRAEEEIRKLNEELKLRAAQLGAANKELEAFSYSVSHDLRAPLRSIDGFSQVLLEDYSNRLDAEGQDYLRRVRAAAERMAQLIDDLLQLSRVTRSDLSRKTVDLSAMARAIAAELQRSRPERQVEFVIAEGLVASGDERLLWLALENLLRNSWKFTSKRSRATIEFGVLEKNGQTTYFVRDDGTGFDMAYADKLFGVFQRLHASDEFPGTGVGLATVQRLVHRHGGSIWAEGKVDQGATFYFTLSRNWQDKEDFHGPENYSAGGR